MADFSGLTMCYMLPRSRSQWFAWLMGHAMQSWHDGMRGCSSPQQFRDRVARALESDRLFVADTGAILFYNTLQALMPGHRSVFVIRNVHDVQKSMERQIGWGASEVIRRASDKLFRHAYGGDQVRFHYGLLHSRVEVERFWTYVCQSTGAPTWLESAMKHIVDVPIRDQPLTPRATKALLAHADKR